MLARWESVLDRLLDRPDAACAGELDWVAKLLLLEGYRERDGLDWDDAKLHLIDLQYADVRPTKGSTTGWWRAGSIERLLTDEEVTRAVARTARGHPRLLPRPCLEQYGPTSPPRPGTR